MVVEKDGEKGGGKEGGGDGLGLTFVTVVGRFDFSRVVS